MLDLIYTGAPVALWAQTNGGTHTPVNCYMVFKIYRFWKLHFKFCQLAVS